MRKYLVSSLLLLLFVGSASAQQTMRLLDLPPGAFALITFDSHDTWVTWAPDDQSLAFISPMSGVPNLYVIELDDLEIVESQLPNLFVARYLFDETVDFPFYPLTFETDTIVDSPSWSRSGAHILVRTYRCEFRLDAPPCFDFTLSLVDVAGQTRQPILDDDEISLSVLGEGSEIYYVGSDTSAVMRYNSESQEGGIVFRADGPIRGIVRHAADLLIATDTEVIKLDPVSQRATSVAPLDMVGYQFALVDDYLIYTMIVDYGPAVGIKHTASGDTVVLLESYDYEPVLSNDGSLVAFLSEGIGGIMIHRLRSDISSYPERGWLFE